MAPRAPTSRATLLAWLRAPDVMKHLPLAVGGPTILAGVVHEEGMWRLRRTVFDDAAFRAFVAEGKSLHPEQMDSFRHPTGEVLVEANSLDAFCHALEQFPWPREWGAPGAPVLG